jgi:transposase
MISLSIHTDFHGRFPDSYHLCSYAGLVPSTHSSGGITYHGSITKRGRKYLRWIMLHCLTKLRIVVTVIVRYVFSLGPKFDII